MKISIELEHVMIKFTKHNKKLTKRTLTVDLHSDCYNEQTREIYHNENKQRIK